MIRFAPGSGHYELGTELFHFEAIDDHIGRVPCVISQNALEDWGGRPIDSEHPLGLFEQYENAIFDLAETVFVLRGTNDKGVLAIASTDIRLPRLA